MLGADSDPRTLLVQALGVTAHWEGCLLRVHPPSNSLSQFPECPICGHLKEHCGLHMAPVPHPQASMTSSLPPT